jgi:hypothetical protein
LLPWLRNVDAFVSDVRREDLAGVYPRAWTECSTVSLKREICLPNWLRRRVERLLTISII